MPGFSEDGKAQSLGAGRLDDLLGKFLDSTVKITDNIYITTRDELEEKGVDVGSQLVKDIAGVAKVMDAVIYVFDLEKKSALKIGSAGISRPAYPVRLAEEARKIWGDNNYISYSHPF